jgi:hypothetical protein
LIQRGFHEGGAHSLRHESTHLTRPRSVVVIVASRNLRPPNLPPLLPSPFQLSAHGQRVSIIRERVRKRESQTSLLSNFIASFLGTHTHTRNEKHKITHKRNALKDDSLPFLAQAQGQEPSPIPPQLRLRAILPAPPISANLVLFGFSQRQ